MFLGRILVALLLMVGMASGQSPGTFIPDQVLPAAQLNAALALKSNYPYIGPIGTSGVTISGTPSVGWIPVAVGSSTAVWSPFPPVVAVGVVVTSPPFNAVCNGATDDTGAINAALAAGPYPVVIPNATCFSATGITVPPGASLQGGSWVGGADPTTFTGGSRILCPINLANPCVEVGQNNGAASTGSVSNLIVQGSGGATLTQGIGIRVDGLFNVSLNQVMVYNFFQGYYWKSYNVLGLGGKMWQVYSGRIKDAHIVVDSWPELQVAQSRFGVDGTGDLGAAAYLRFASGARANPAAAANTFDCMNCQFNEGHGGFPVNHWVEFVNYTSGFPTDDAEIFRFTNNHTENVNYGIYTDSSWNVLYDFRVTSSSFAFFNDAFSQINSATVLESFVWTANNINAGTVTLNVPTGGRGISFIGNWFQQAVTFDTPPTGGRLMATGNSFQGGYTVNGTSWLSVNLTGNESSTAVLSTNTQLSSPMVALDASTNRKIISSSPVTLTMVDLSAAANTKNWDMFAQTGLFQFRAVSDDYLSSTTPFSCTRTGATSTGCNIQFPASTTGAGAQTFTNSPCSGLTTERWVPITISGQTGTWYLPACQ
jgi:hypothetical protein